MAKISPTQIKAARAMLNWSQMDLAKATSLSVTTIRTLELGKIPRASTLQDICKTLEENGVEFIEGDGVKRRNMHVITLVGADSCDKLFEDIFITIGRHPTEALVFSRTENVLLQKSGLNRWSNIERLEELQKKTAVKCLLTGTSRPSFRKPLFQLRTTSQPFCGAPSCFIYGDKYANVLSDGTSSFLAVIFCVAATADKERREFLSIWRNASAV